MKTNLNLLGRLAVAVVTIVSLAGFSARAEDTHLSMKGAQHLQHLNTTEQARELKSGDTIAMACSMCKNVAVTRVERQKGREFLTPGTKHECSMCGGTVEVVGQRMDRKEIVKHSCSKCGGESAFCCATKRGSGKTEGMDTK